VGVRILNLDFVRHWNNKTSFVVGLAGLLAIATGCHSPKTNNTNTPTTENNPAVNSAVITKVAFNKQIISDFADKIVVPTNQLFALKAKELSLAVDAFVKSPNEKTLKAAQTAWIAARSPWEQSECFGFGPAKSLGYDGSLDTWPVNDTDLKKVLNSQEPITAEYIEKRQDTEKGFHVIEYLLFNEENNRQPQDLKKRELQYLQALAQDFSKVAELLADSWVKGVPGKPAYREVIATSGDSNNSTYPTIQSGVEEMLGGMVTSLGEVADSKIDKAFKQQDSKLAESRFSLNTLTDMKHNVEGSQNVYLGRFLDGKTSGMGLTNHIVQVNPTVDQKVKQQFQIALDALNKIPEPFEKSVVDPQHASAIKAAQNAVRTLADTLDQEVKPLIKN
jgi:putative iron-regulated protein